MKGVSFGQPRLGLWAALVLGGLASAEALAEPVPDPTGEVATLVKRGRSRSRSKQPAELRKSAQELGERCEAMYDRGEDAEALEVCTNAFHLTAAVEPPQTKPYITRLFYVGVVLEALDRLDEAEAIYRRVLALEEDVFGRHDKELSGTLASVAAVLRKQGRDDEAEPLLRRAIAIDKATRGPNDADYAYNVGSLAYLYADQGRWEEALPLHRQAVAIIERAVEENDPAKSHELRGLAWALYNTGHGAESITLFRRVLAIDEVAYGPESIAVAYTLQRLGFVLHLEGQYAEAETTYRRALDLYPTTFGEVSEPTSQTLQFFAGLLKIQGRLDEAKALYLRKVEVDQALHGADSSELTKALGLLGEVLFLQEDYLASERYYRRALALDPGPDTLLYMGNLAFLLQEQHRYDEAIAINEKRLVKAESDHGPRSPEVAGVLNDLAEALREGSRHDEAEPLLDRALRIDAKGSPEEARDLAELARVYEVQGREVEAEPLLRRAIEVTKNQPEVDDAQLATYRNNLGKLLYALGRFAEAEEWIRKALAQAEGAAQKNPHALSARLNNLAEVKEAVGELDEVESLLRRAVAVAAEAFGPEDPRGSSFRSNLAGFLLKVGRYAEAEPIYLSVLKVEGSTFGPNHLRSGEAQHDLGNFYLTTGQSALAVKFHNAALDIAKDQLGPDHPLVGSRLNDFGIALLNSGQPEAAEKALRLGLTISEAARGPKHPRVANRLSNLANVLQQREKFAEAERLYDRALSIRRELFGSDHVDVATTLNNIGGLYAQTERYGRAAKGYREAMGIFERAYGAEHPKVGVIASNLATMELARDNFDEARTYLERALEIEERNLATNLLSGTPMERATRLSEYANTTSAAITMHLLQRTDDATFATLALQTWLRRKGRLEDLEQSVLKRMREFGTPEQLRLLDEMERASARYASLGTRPPRDAERRQAWQADHDAAFAAQLRAQQALTAASRLFQQTLSPITVPQVAGALPDGTALLEIVTYEPWDAKIGKFGDPRYGAYLVTATGSVTGVDLGPIDVIDRRVTTFRQAVDAAKPVGGRAQALREMTFDRLTFPAGLRHLYIASDGALSLVPFEAVLTVAPSANAVPRSISYLTSGRELLREPPTRTRQAKPVVVYDVDYDRAADRASGVLKARADHWTPLPATRAEGSAVAGLLRKAQTLSGDAATEDAVMGLERPSVLHIASHGYIEAVAPANPQSRGGSLRGLDVATVMPQQPAVDVYGQSLSPMVRTGIVLAGANLRPEDDDDGLLSAAELAYADLRGTTLVTLSACSTGEGEIRTGDGVYGLRRALVLAGSQVQVLSLWKVDDDATSALMQKMYAELGNGATANEALMTAREAIRSTPKWRHPVFWAAFTLSGDPAQRL